MLAAPAGTGKSVLAGQLADESGARVGWCRLAPGWNRATDIVGMALDSLSAQSATQEDPQAHLDDDLHAAADQVLEILEAEPTCLVIDDLHEGGSDAELLLAEVAGFLPADATIIVTSRRRPTEFIGRCDPAVVRVIEGADLRFDPEEAGRLFGGRGIDIDPDEAVAATNGWAAALVASGDLGASTGTGDFSEVIAGALAPDLLGDLHRVAMVTALLPYVSAELLVEIEAGTEGDLRRLAETTSLIAETGDVYRLHDAARQVLIPRVEPAEAADIRGRAAGYLAAEDAITAIELFIEADRPADAGDLLAARASEIGPARATRWLYQLPADVRRSLPPVLAAGRATVNVNLAIETARRTVAEAPDTRTEREGLLGLGSLLLADGSAGEAAATLESASRLAGDDRTFATLAGEQLGLARWLAGDLSGARAAVADLDPHPWVSWLLGTMALLDGNGAAARSHAAQAIALADGVNVTTGPGLALEAAADVIDGADGGPAATRAAYEDALEVGGRDLGAAAPVHAWALVRSGELEEAQAVADQIERDIGRHDAVARLHVALLRRAVGDPDLSTRQRNERRVADLRSAGLTPVERLADLLAPSQASAATSHGLVVNFCGSFRLLVDGEPLDASAWKSKKALEVCAHLALAGEQGRRREQVIEAVWEGRDPDKGRTLLRTALSEIRRVLEPRRGAGQESRFVATTGDRVIVRARTDVGEAAERRTDDAIAAFGMIAPGPASDLPDVDWIHELTPAWERDRIELATRAVADGSPDVVIQAYEVLIEAEPWNRDHFDGLAAAHRAAGEDLAADDVERRWFADD